MAITSPDRLAAPKREQRMERGKKPNNKRTASQRPRRDNGTAATFHAHLIRIPDTEAMRRAVMVLGEVRVPYCGFADSRLLIANEHLEALPREEIPFEMLS